MDIIVRIIFLIPLVISVIVCLVLFRIELLKGGIKFEFLRKMIFLVIGISVLEAIGRIILFYWQLKKSPIGIYLLPGKGTAYFVDKIFSMALPIFIGVLIGIILLSIVALIRRYSKRPLFSEADQWVLFLAGFLVGFPGVFILILGSMVVMVIVLIFSSLIKKEKLVQQRLLITPYILFVTIMILILENFSFYQSFIN